MFLLFASTSDVEQKAFSCLLKVCRVISGLRRAAGRLFHSEALPANRGSGLGTCTCITIHCYWQKQKSFIWNKRKWKQLELCFQYASDNEKQKEMTHSLSTQTWWEVMTSCRQVSARCLLAAWWCSWLHIRWKPRRLSNFLLSEELSSGKQQWSNYIKQRMQHNTHLYHFPLHWNRRNVTAIARFYHDVQFQCSGNRMTVKDCRQ